jgi:hypothetical protein
MIFRFHIEIRLLIREMGIANRGRIEDQLTPSFSLPKLGGGKSVTLRF